MTASDALMTRKSDHLRIVASGAGSNHRATTGFEEIRFEHCALPECNLGDVDLSVDFLGKSMKAPLLISSMTGGPEQASTINRNLATAAEKHGIAFAVGSQRIAIERGNRAGIDSKIRALAPTIPIFANFGAAQIGLGYGRDQAMRAIDMIEADALIVHLNPLQEAVQRGGDHGWAKLLGSIERLARDIPTPLIVKEVGFGISARVARQLEDSGVAAIDVAGAGGTNWAMIEAERADCAADRAIAMSFSEWGNPTAHAIAASRKECPSLPLIGSGGIKSGIDVAKAIRLGADIVGQAAGLLEAALISADAVDEAIHIVIEQLRISCFCTGSRDIAALRNAPLIERRTCQ